MAVCLECKADYIRGITVCPACGRELEPDDAPAVEEPSHDFVELMGAPYGAGMAAAASLEAAGLETRVNTIAPNIYMTAAVNVIVLVRERDLDVARSLLRMEPPHTKCEERTVDEDVASAVEALNRQQGVRTVCSCSGAHPGAGRGFISLAPQEGADFVPLFDDFVQRIQDRVKASGLALAVDWSAVHGAEITLVDSVRAKETWKALARLVSDLSPADR